MVLTPAARPRKINITISQGVASVKPTEDLEPSTIVDSADAALYRAKRDGRNGIAVA